MKTPLAFWSDLTKRIFKAYGESPGSMLVHTGAIGWVLSSAAQISAVIMNNKLSPEQKMFLIPQEAGDAAVNIISFYTLTNGIKHIGSKLTKSAKIRSAAIEKLLEDRGLILHKGQKRAAGKVYAGDWDFDITKLRNYRFDIAPTFKPFNNGAEVIAGLSGSILSCNIVTPILRNLYASKKQQKMIDHYNDWKALNPNGLSTKLGKTMFESFTSRAYSRAYPFSGNMKV